VRRDWLRDLPGTATRERERERADVRVKEVSRRKPSRGPMAIRVRAAYFSTTELSSFSLGADCRLHAIARECRRSQGGGEALCARGRSRCRARIAIFEEMMSVSVMARRLRSPLSFAAEAHNVSGASDPSDHKPRLPRSTLNRPGIISCASRRATAQKQRPCRGH